MQDRKLKVVQIIDRLHIGGAERVVVTLSNLLQEHNHNVKVITTVSPGPLIKQLDKDISYINLNRKWKWNIITMRKLIKELKNYDVIHIHSVHNLRYVFLASKLFSLKKQIFYHEHHGARVDTQPTTTQKRILRNTVFIAVSSKLKEWAIDKLNIPDNKVFLLPNTVKKERGFPAEKKDKQLKRVVVISNFVPIKNIEFAVQLFTDLQKKFSGIRLTIIGQVGDKDYYYKIKNLIDQNDLQKNVTIITDNENIQQILNQFDLALHTSVSESGPVSLIECLAQGLPFITYNTGEVVEEIKNKIPLAVMHSFDTDEWVKRIETLLALPFDDLSSKFSNVYDHYFSPETYYRRVMEIYESVLGNA